MIFLFFFYLLTASTFLSAQSPSPTASPAVSPSPAPKPVDVKAEISAQEVDVNKLPFAACEETTLYQSAGPVFFTKIPDNGIYFLKDMGLITAKNPIQSFQLVFFDFDKRKSKSVFALKQKGLSVLLPSHETIQGVSLLSFTDQNAICHYGKSKLTHISFIRKGAGKAVSEVGYFGAILSQPTNKITDLAKRFIFQADMNQFQTRPLRGFAVDEKPLYYNSFNQIFIALRKEANAAKIVKYSRGGKDPDYDVKLNQKDRLVLNGERVMLVTPDFTKNMLTFKECQTLYKIDKTVKSKKSTNECIEFSMTLPQPFAVDQGVLDINFDRGVAVFTARDDNIAKAWGKALVFDYRKHIIIQTIAAKEKSYIGFGKLSEDGKLAVFEVKDFATRKTLKLILLETAQNKKVEIKL